MDKEYDIVIVGGGASGLAAAISAKRKDPAKQVLILEKNKKPARKILATGNGRCNLSNVRCLERDAVLEFFESIGIITREDADGRIYPYTEDAKDVADALISEAGKLGVEIVCSAAVTACSFDDKAGRYIVMAERKEHGNEKISVSAGRLLLAAGGKAAPEFGTTGDGAILARKLYHTVTKLAPALTAVETRENTKALAGVRAKAKVSLITGGGTAAEETGEVQFTDYGVSGICVFDMTRYMTIPEGRTLINGFDDYSLEIDFLPGIKDAEPLVQKGIRLVKREIREYINNKTSGDPEMTAWMLKHFILHPSGLRGWDHAQITKGGVKLTEIDMDRMASKFMPGLYFAGEIIDHDGPCGGFNLQNAWETGIRAGLAMAEDNA